MSQNKRYYIIDAASESIEIDDLIQAYGPSVCILKSNYDGQFVDVGPHLFGSTEKLDELMLNEKWGKGSYTLVSFTKDKQNLIQILKNNSEIVTEQDEVMFFRYYDPRILRIFLPIFDKQQLKEFFGTISEFMCEDEDPGYGLIFHLDKASNLITYRLLTEDFKKYLMSGDQSLLTKTNSNITAVTHSTNHEKKPKDKPGGKSKFSIFD